LQEFGGGRLNDWGPHLFSQVYEWFGDRPLSLTGYTVNVRPENECDDLFTADFLFHGHVRVSVMMNGFSYLRSPRWEVFGNEGTLQVTGDIHGEFLVHWKRRDGQESQQTYRRQEVAPPVPIYPSIVNHLQSGGELCVSLHEGVVVSQWLETVRNSGEQPARN
jgi:predicted dehydrogenase